MRAPPDHLRHHARDRPVQAAAASRSCARRSTGSCAFADCSGAATVAPNLETHRESISPFHVTSFPILATADVAKHIRSRAAVACPVRPKQTNVTAQPKVAVNLQQEGGDGKCSVPAFHDAESQHARLQILYAAYKRHYKGAISDDCLGRPYV